MTWVRSIALALLASVSILTPSLPAWAADSPVGTWVKKGEGSTPVATLIIESWGSGKGKLTWRFKGTDIVMTVVSALDGSDAPVLLSGKPSEETMAIKLVDKRHSMTVVKMSGKPFGTSKAAFSEDFKTMTVENDFSTTIAGNPSGKSTEIWVRK
jgi:hypothetical protein